MRIFYLERISKYFWRIISFIVNLRNSLTPVTVKGILKAVRLQNLLMLVFAQYFTAVFLCNPTGDWQHVVVDSHLFLLSLSTVLIAAAGYIINDYYDIKIDLVNHPDKVIVGIDVSRRIAIVLHSIFNVAGIAIGAYISLYFGVINVIAAFFLWWYSNFLKRLPFIGNLIIGFLSGLAIVLIAFLYPESTREIIIYGFFAGFFSLIREIIKDLEDLAGDEKFGCKTLPVVWGVRKTKLFVYVLVFLFTVSVYYLTSVNFSGIWVELNLILLLLNSIFIYRLILADKKKDFGWLSSYCKVILLLGILSMMFVI